MWTVTREAAPLCSGITARLELLQTKLVSLVVVAEPFVHWVKIRFLR
jgi:hypothetical protein